MKKLLLSTVVLFLFSLSILLFQISCKKDAIAQVANYVLPVATTSKLGGVMPDGSTISVDANGKISAIASGSQPVQKNKILYIKSIYSNVGNTNKYDSGEIWSANYDGTNQQKLNIVLPNGYVIALSNSVKLSPDGSTIFFTAFSTVSNSSSNSGPWNIYACNLDGSNVRSIVAGTTTSGVETQVAY